MQRLLILIINISLKLLHGYNHISLSIGTFIQPDWDVVKVSLISIVANVTVLI